MAYEAEIDDGDGLTLTNAAEPTDVSEPSLEAHDAYLLHLPRLEPAETPPYQNRADLVASFGGQLSRIETVIDTAPAESVFAVLSQTELLPYLTKSLDTVNFQRSIAVRLDEPDETGSGLDDEFLSLSIFTKGYDALSISKVRTAYRYCPACEKTTKDYGGKKHLYDSFGTLQRDVWKHPDICLPTQEPFCEELIERVRDTLSSGRHDALLAVDRRVFSDITPTTVEPIPAFGELAPTSESPDRIAVGEDTLHNGDAIDLLSKTPDDAVDLVFLDPPYNIGKEYDGYDDERGVDEYYQWCEEWLQEVVRVLRPGGVAVVLNLPESIHHHYRYLGQELKLTNWICWDSMSRPPAGNIMPTNYPVLVFSNGEPSTLNYRSLELRDESELLAPSAEFEYETIYPLDDRYCKRKSCRNQRTERGVIDRKELTTLWTDVFRLKHNSKREDHPTMLPPKLVRRLVWLFTEPGDTVLDPFNGVGTTTLTAAQLGRHYTGFELSEKYLEIARRKHDQLDSGLDPFDKQSESISPPSSDTTEYKVPKRELQLEVKRIAERLNHVPDKEEVDELGRYSIQYYEEYFDGWADATKAARTTGMSEERDDDSDSQSTLYNYTE